MALALTLVAGTASAQTVVEWGGGFPNDKLTVGSNWAGGSLPLNDGTETLQFTDNSGSYLDLNAPANFDGISLLSTGDYNSVHAVIRGRHLLTLGEGGVSTSGGWGSYFSITFDVPLVLSANQTWNAMGMTFGSITANRSISGDYALTLDGNGNYETFTLNSRHSTFTGGVTLSSANSTLVVGASSSGPAGAPDHGPLGTGPLVLGNGTTLTTSGDSPITLANPVTIGDATTGNPVTLGGGPGFAMMGGPPANLTLTGPVTLVGYSDPDLTIDIGSNSTVTFAGDLTASSHYLWLRLSGGMNGNSLAILQGNLTNVTGAALNNGISVILDGPGPSQVAGVVDGIETGPSTYLGLGSGYATTGGVTAFLSYLRTTDSDTWFQGTLGFDTTSGSPAAFNDPIDLSNFRHDGSFVGLGSSTAAILGPGAVITPPNGGNTYFFGGGGGTLTVQSDLPDLAEASYSNLYLNPGNAPLTLVLSGALSYTGATSVSGAALIFDTPLPSSTFNMADGYIGVTPNAGYTDVNENIQSFVNRFSSESSGVIGFDSFTGPLTIASDIVMPLGGSGLYLGTATAVNFTGAITPNFNNSFQFAGVKGGQVTVSSQLTDQSVDIPNSVVIGLPSALESVDPTTGLRSASSVTLAGDNTYTGGTILQSGYLYVTNGNSLGYGDLIVPVGGGNGWSGTLAVSSAAGGPVTLQNNIQIGGNGLALNTGGTNTLTLAGTISNHFDTYGSLGIFGPVDIEGESDNTYSGGTTIDTGGATVTVGKDRGLGFGEVGVKNALLSFTSPDPEVYGLTISNSTATFDGSPVIDSLRMTETTLNFNGAEAMIDGISSDAPKSGNQISLGDGTALTIDLSEGYNNPTYYGRISGGNGSLTVIGTGMLDLRGRNTYGGGTTLNGEALIIASSNQAVGSGPVTINGGSGLITNTGVTLTNALTLNDGGGLGGYGTFSPGGMLTFQNTSVIDPGSAGMGNNEPVPPAPGKLSFGGGTSITFGPGGICYFSISDANGAPGTGYSTIDLATGGGSLNLTSTAETPFTIQLYSFDPATNQPAPVPSFNPTQAYSWTLVSAASITGTFDPTFFNVDASSYFRNSTGTGQFYVSESGNNLMLDFTPVPEPSTWALMAGGLWAIGAAIRRRKR